MLLGARWDGNVRELKNAVERACILTEGSTITERELAGAFGDDSALAGRPPRPEMQTARPAEPPAALDEVERDHIVEVLRQVSGNRMAAAKVLGISRRALYRRLERHGIGAADGITPRSPFGRRG
jgi:two-component system response regulator AtoC